MDTDSTAANAQESANNKEVKSTLIVADQLNPYANEFFYVGDYINKYSFRFNLEKKLDSLLSELETAQAEAAKAPQVVTVAQAAPVVKAVEPVNFWTTPVKFRSAKPSSTISNFKVGETALHGCDCADCTGTHDCLPATAGGAKQSSVSIVKTLAPIGWCALFLVCSLAVITQLATISESSTAATQRLCDSGNYQEALKISDLAVRCNPFSASAYYERARVLTHMMQYHEAEACFNHSLTFNPSNVAALDARAALSLKLGKPQQTIADSKKLLALKGNQLTAMQYGNMAVAYYKTGKFEDAIHYYDRALSADRQSLTLELGKSYCLSGKQQHKQALASCNNLIKQYGAKSQVLALRGYCLQRLHDLAGAQHDFNLALAQEPNNPTYHSYRAALMKELNRPEAALKDYQTAANLDRDSAQAQYVVAKMLKDLGRNKEALAYYERLGHFSSFVYSFDQHEERAALYYSAGRYEACLTDLKRALELKPEANLYARKALCLAHLGQSAEAREAIAVAQTQTPDSPKVLLAEAQVDAILGQSVSAVDKFTKVLGADASNNEALLGRGQLYFSRGQWASAAQDYRKAMAMGACDATVKGNLAQCDRVLSSCARISLDVPKQQIVDMTKLAGAEVETAGRKAYQDGEMHMASLYFAELVKRQPANLDGRRLLGHALEGAGDHTQAVAVFEPMSLGGQLAINDQFCYAHALAASGLYDRSIAIMQRLHEGQPANMTYRLELTKMFSAAGQLDKAIGMCRDSLAMSGTSEDRKNLNNVYESLLTQQLRGKKVGSTAADAASATRADTEG